MLMSLYRYDGLPEVINKLGLVEFVASITATNQPSNQVLDLMNPTYMIGRNNAYTIDDVNYANIDGRWYFILDWELTSATTYKVNLHLDVLMTYRENVLNLNVLLERSAYGSQQAFLHDPMVPISSEPSISTYSTLNEFRTEEAYGTYVMVVSQTGYATVTAGPDGPSTPDEVYGPRTGASTIGVYLLTKQQVFELAGDLGVTELTEKLVYFLVGSPSEAIITMMWLPGIRSSLVTSEADVYLKLGNVAFNGGIGSATAIVTKAVVEEYVTYDLGSINFDTQLAESFLDMSPYTKLELHLPFYGTVTIHPEDFYPSQTMFIRYKINVTSGACVIQLYRDNPDQGGVMTHQFNTTFGVTVPFTTQTHEDMLSRLVTASTGAAIAGATVATSPVGPAVAGAAINTANAARQGTALTSLANHLDPSQVPNNDRNISVGGLDAESGMLGIFKPYLRVFRPIVPEGYRPGYNEGIRKLIGTPDYRDVQIANIWNGAYFKAAAIGNPNYSFGGMTRPAHPIPRYAWDEISQLLKGGVFK